MANEEYKTADPKPDLTMQVTKNDPVSLKYLLESCPPGTERIISLASDDRKDGDVIHVALPNLKLYCDGEDCKNF